MLNRLTLKNFRAFKSQGFNFSKINVFVGPNNSGKSSAVSALNVLAQTFHDDDISQSPLVLNGQFDRLGTFLDVVHGNRSNTPMGIEIELSTTKIKLEYKYRIQRREIELVKYDIEDRNKSVFSYHSKKDGFDLNLLGQSYEDVAGSLKKRRPKFMRLVPISRFGMLSADEKAVMELPLDHREILYQIDRDISRARMQLNRVFANFDSISPFRDRPERTHLYSGESAQRIGTTGSNTAAILANDSAKRGGESLEITKEISDWFKLTGIAEGIKIKSLTPRHFEIVLFDSNGAEHNICDVGFGCSQVLPVLTASLKIFKSAEAGARQPTLMIQEPEIHLHPNAQASLGTFFAQLLQRRGQIFIETHSDNLVLRLARHVAEGMLTPGDVKIFYVHKVNEASEVLNIEIGEDGRFIPEWPGGFFPQRQAESLALAQAAFNSRKSRQAESHS